MTNLQDQLKAVSKTLTSLSKQLEVISKKVDKVPASKTASKTAGKKTVAKPAPKKSADVKVAAHGDASATVLDSVLDVIRRSRNGATIAKLKEKTGLEARQLSNALYKLSKRGKIEAKARGLYVKSKS
jgi:predicted Rossmann fold nucleotide-binding protein DprA/Smf involved in DNA uptake